MVPYAAARETPMSWTTWMDSKGTTMGSALSEEALCICFVPRDDGHMSPVFSWFEDPPLDRKMERKPRRTESKRSSVGLMYLWSLWLRKSWQKEARQETMIAVGSDRL